MIQIRFIRADGTEQTIQTPTGQSLMKAAVDADVRGIEADCGGSLTCATCHVMLDEPWIARLPAAIADERDMLDFAASPVDINSADAQTLADGLNGIGMSKAQAIVAYRNEHGPFSSADQLAEVKGIGQALVEKNRDSIVVGGKAKAKAAPAG